MNRSSTDLLFFSSISEGIEFDIVVSGVAYCGILMNLRRSLFSHGFRWRSISGHVSLTLKVNALNGLGCLGFYLVWAL